MGTTLDELIEIHRKLKHSPVEERILGVEKILFEYL